MADVNKHRVTIQRESSYQRRVPAHASAQRDYVLRLLREAKVRGRGLRKEEAIFTYRITQVPARVFELESMGYVIRHELEPDERFVTFFLVSEPEQEKPLPAYRPKGPDPRQSSFANSSDWYERQTGEKRPAASPSDLGPLFSKGSL